MNSIGRSQNESRGEAALQSLNDITSDNHLNGTMYATKTSVNVHVNGYANGHVNDHSAIKLDCNTATPTSSPEPIAICGMAMRLPGGIHDDQGFWDALYNGKDMRSPIPPERYNAGGFSDVLGKKGAIKTQHGYFLNHDLSSLDASFFTMTKTDLEKTDPQQRQILEVTRECLENAGEVDYRGKSVGCYVGTFGEDWLHSQSKENQTSGAFSGSGDLMIANRVSYEFDFKGPRCVRNRSIFRTDFELTLLQHGH